MRGFHPSMAVFSSLPLVERLFVHARLFSAPLETMARHAKGTRMLDVGCGHGVLSALLAVGHPERSVVSIDPDLRKIVWARRSVGRLANVTVQQAALEAVASEQPASFDSIFVADVLYLLPLDAWSGFLAHCRAALKPSGRLILKEAEDDGSWKAKKTLLQERLMVGVGRTQQSGAVGFQSRPTILRAIEAAGFRVCETTSLASGYSTTHVLVVADCP
jgi:2-polyprenyl-6-hydroxyphenyl methylase/3-demethylubiquinone-9 3-methyltransferase